MYVDAFGVIQTTTEVTERVSNFGIMQSKPARSALYRYKGTAPSARDG